jgi:hypothetical protein
MSYDGTGQADFEPELDDYLDIRQQRDKTNHRSGEGGDCRRRLEKVRDGEIAKMSHYMNKIEKAGDLQKLVWLA